ncbi:MAG: helix-turn-helix transcriptional regulator [Deltaproteobacteria bacterium]|nr:helix-turn-helix transcriptional regulator [Deltaproteobacteria bacterium]
MLTQYEKLIIKRLREYQKKQKLKQKELAHRLNWSPSKLNDILKGRSPIGKNLLQQISDKGISIDIEEKTPANRTNKEDIELTELVHELIQKFTKEQKHALKTIISGLDIKKHRGA